MQNTLNHYDNIIADCKSLFKKKLVDYGSAWRILRLPSLTDQILIKAQRIRSIQLNEIQKVDEGQADEFIGIVNYSIMSLIQIEKGHSEMPDLDNDECIVLYDKMSENTRSLMLNKNHDYGEAWREMRVSSLTDLILQKLLRIKQIDKNNGNTLVSEGVDANIADIVNYSVFALIHLQND